MIRMRQLRRVDIQVSILTAIIVVIACAGVFFVNYSLSHDDMIRSLQDRVLSMYGALEPHLEVETFKELGSAADEIKPSYQRTKALLESVKNAAGVRYLYTATRTRDGRYIYLVDGLPVDSDDFRHAGEPIEPEIIPDLEHAMAGETVMPDEIKPTSWGYIFISYLPVHDGENVVGVLGIEFDAEHQYKTYRLLRVGTPLVAIFACLAGGLVAMTMFRRISNPTFKDLSMTDFLTGLRNRNAFEVLAGNTRSSRTLSGLAVLSVDLDGLKTVNDTLGHQAGDDYIRACAEILRSLIHLPDTLYRLGGDEFAAILQGKNRDDLQRLLAQLNTAEEASNRVSRMKVSLSVGYAIFDAAQDKDLYATLERADAAMYENKRKRRLERT